MRPSLPRARHVVFNEVCARISRTTNSQRYEENLSRTTEVRALIV